MGFLSIGSPATVLRHCSPPTVRRILEELPDSLDETYEHILREIRKPNQGHAHQLPQCPVAAVRPLESRNLQNFWLLILMWMESRSQSQV